MGFFKSLLKLIAIILVIIAIILIIYAAIIYATEGAIGAGLATFFEVSVVELGWGMLLAGIGGLLVAAIISPDGFSEAMKRVGDGLSTTADVIGDTVGSVVGSTADALFSSLRSPLIWAAGAFVGYKYFTRDTSENDKGSTSSYDNELEKSDDSFKRQNRLVRYRTPEMYGGLYA